MATLYRAIADTPYLVNEDMTKVQPSTGEVLGDLVFIHGLDGSYDLTWRTAGAESFLPSWLAADIPDIAVWSMSYVARSSRWQGSALPILQQSTNLLAEMRNRNIGRRPICLVGHSLGGLMIKQLLRTGIERAVEFPDIAANVSAVIFVATPHTGSDVVQWAKNMRIIFRPTDLVRDLDTDNHGLRDLNSWYRTWASNNKLATLVLCETEPIIFRRLITKNMIVPPLSSNPELPNVTPLRLEGTNHRDICKPSDRVSEAYRYVYEFVQDFRRAASPDGYRDSAPKYEPVSAPDRVTSTASPDSPLALHRRVFEGSGWRSTLARLYPSFRLIEFGHSYFPIWAEIAPPEERREINIALNWLDESSPVDSTGYPDSFDRLGKAEHDRRLRYLSRWNFNDATYALDRIWRSGHGRIRIDGRRGTYFWSVATSELLDREFMLAQAKTPERDLALDALPMRRRLHEITGGEDVVFDGRGRSAALSVAVSMIFPEADGTYSALLSRRSKEVATHPHLAHVAPAGILAPTSQQQLDGRAPGTSQAEPVSNWLSEFSVEETVLREYAEELFGYADFEQDTGDPSKVLRDTPPVRELLRAIDDNVIELRYCGVSIPLLTLRPEVCVLLFVRDQSWWAQELDRAAATDHGFQLNWEYDTKQLDRDGLKLRLDSKLFPVDESDIDPAHMVPHAAASLNLGTQVAREILFGDRS